MTVHEDRREVRRAFMRRNWPWMVPLALVAGAGMFIGVGFLVAWLWRVTLSDIFGIKAISFSASSGFAICVPTEARPLTFIGTASGSFAEASADSASVAEICPLPITARAAWRPGGRSSNRTSIGPSKPSVRNAVTVTGTLPPTGTLGLRGATLKR